MGRTAGGDLMIIADFRGARRNSVDCSPGRSILWRRAKPTGDSAAPYCGDFPIPQGHNQKGLT